MKKQNVLLFIISLITSVVFFSCKKNKFNSGIKFVEINISEENSKDIHLFVSRAEITQAQYSEIMKANPSKIVDEQLPVTNISYEDACRFCNKLSKLSGLEEVYEIEEISDEIALNKTNIKEIANAQGFRLLRCDEAYTIYYNLTYIKSKGNLYHKTGEGWHGTRLHKTAHFMPDKFGLFDFCGNAREYVYFSQKDFQEYFYSYEEKQIEAKTKVLKIESVQTSEELKPYLYTDDFEKYKEYFLNAEDVTGFRICCPASVDKSKIDILLQKDVEKDIEQWNKTNFENYKQNLEFVNCSEYSYEAVGFNPDDSKKKINIYVPEINACKNEVSKELFNFIIYGQIYDGIETPDFLIGPYSRRSYRSQISEEDLSDIHSTLTNITFEDAIQFCNRLSELSGLMPCYAKSEPYAYNPAANGYRLPTKAEFISFEAQNNSNMEIDFDPTHWNWVYDSDVDDFYTTDMYNPFTHFDAYYFKQLIYRFSERGRKPISNSVTEYEVYNYKDSKSPNFCLRIFQTANPEQIKQYQIEQEEVIKSKINEVFDSLVTMEKYEGGLKEYKTLPPAELADFELSETNFSNYLYTTLTGKYPYSSSKNLISLEYEEIAELCNKLSEIRGLTKCYYQRNNIWECDYTKNGFRLPTVAEVMCKNDRNWNTRSLCNNIFISNVIPVWETSFPSGDYNLKDEKRAYTYAWGDESLDYIFSGQFHLCRTLDSDKMEELLQKRADEKKQLVQQVDELLDMVEIDGGKYTMTYYDEDSKKNVAQTKNIKPFYIQSTKFSLELSKKTLDSNNSDYIDLYKLNFIRTLVACNKFSLMANLTPAYKINGKILPTESELNEIEDKYYAEFDGDPTNFESFKYTIEYDPTATGYQLPSEIEWEYAGTLGEDTSEEIKLITSISKLKPEPPTASGLYLMNTIFSEWCNDKAPLHKNYYEYYEYYDEIDESAGRGRGIVIETRVTRAHCGKDVENYTEKNYWGSSYTQKQEKRENECISSERSFRLLRYK